MRQDSAKRLPRTELRHIYPPFLKEVQERSAPDYAARYVGMLNGHYQRLKEGDLPPHRR